MAQSNGLIPDSAADPDHVDPDNAPQAKLPVAIPSDVLEVAKAAIRKRVFKRKASDIAAKKFHCDLCSYSFGSKSELKIHFAMQKHFDVQAEAESKDTHLNRVVHPDNDKSANIPLKRRKVILAGPDDVDTDSDDAPLIRRRRVTLTGPDDVDVDSDDAPLIRRPKVTLAGSDDVDVDSDDTPRVGRVRITPVGETSSEKEARLRAANIAAKRYFYEICQHPFGKASGSLSTLTRKSTKITLPRLRPEVSMQLPRSLWTTSERLQPSRRKSMIDGWPPTSPQRNTIVLPAIIPARPTVLWIHLQKNKHADNVALIASGGVVTAPKKVPANRRKALNEKRAATIAARTFVCEPCNIACGSGSELRNHRKAQRHLNNVAMTESTASEAS